MIRVLLVDDHGIVRRGIAQILSSVAGVEVAGEAASGEEALSKARADRYDVVLLDLSMPGRGGLDVIRDLRSSCPGIKVIILSIYSEVQFAVRCLKDGASAYLTKSNADEELVKAILTVASGHRFITAEVAERLAYYVECETERPPHDRLSRREYQILLLLGSGLTVTEAASRLCLSVKTVSAHRSRILSKMGLTSSARLIKYVVDHGLASCE